MSREKIIPFKSCVLDYNLTDLGNSKRFIEQYGNDLLYCHDTKEWYIWTDNRWERDASDYVREMCHRTAVSIHDEIARGEDKEDRARIYKHAVKSESAKSISAMESLARSNPEVATIRSNLDLPSPLLNFKNLSIDLTERKIIQSPGHHHMQTLQMGCNLYEDALCPTWDKFVHDIMGGDPVHVEFLRRAIGYSLTSDTDEQCLFFLYGTGRNGKSTFIETLMALFGQYATKIKSSILMGRQSDSGAEQEKARLIGKRLVVSSELDEGQKFSETLIKDLTGNDLLTARELYGRTFTFKPFFKLWIYGNHKPTIRGTDDGIWRRFKVVPFDQTFSGEQCDPHLQQKLLKELPGIFTWALAGLVSYYEDGLGEPPEITQATAEYRKEMDAFGAFLDECCIIGPHYQVHVGDLYASYKDWAHDGEERVLSKRGFGMQMKKRGFAQAKTKYHRSWAGIGIIQSDRVSE